MKAEDFTPEATLFFVRKRWGVESFHNLMVQVMHLKAGDWARQKLAPIAMAGMSALALNFVALFRQRYLREHGYRHYVSYPQLLQVFMVVLTAANIAPLLELKDKSVRADDEEALDLDADEELEALYARRFKEKELDLVIWAMKKLIGRIIKKATEFVLQARDRLFGFATKLVEVPLLTR